MPCSDLLLEFSVRRVRKWDGPSRRDPVKVIGISLSCMFVKKERMLHGRDAKIDTQLFAPPQRSFGAKGRPDTARTGRPERLARRSGRPPVQRVLNCLPVVRPPFREEPPHFLIRRGDISSSTRSHGPSRQPPQPGGTSKQSGFHFSEIMLSHKNETHPGKKLVRPCKPFLTHKSLV